MKRLRTAVIGCGHFASTHAAILSQLDRVKLVAFSDIVIDNARNFNGAYAEGKGQVFADFHEMFDRVDLDLVYICLPPFAHSDEVHLAAQHGAHIFIEKPISLSMDLARSMVQAVESAGLKSQVGFKFRFGGAVERVKKMIESGEAGSPGLMTARYFCNSLHRPWWIDRSKSGGQLVEQVIHTFDLVRYFLGEPLAVYSRQENLFHREVPSYTAEDISGTVVIFANGALGVIAATNGAIPGKWINDYRLVTRNLTVDFSDENHAVINYTAVDPVESEDVVFDNDIHLAETLDLLDAIEQDRPTRVPIIEGTRTLELVLAAGTSAEERREVPVGR